MNTRSPGSRSSRPTREPVRSWSFAVRGRLSPALWAAKVTSPLQSKPRGTAPPKRYGSPSMAVALATIRARGSAGEDTAGADAAGADAAGADAACDSPSERRRSGAVGSDPSVGWTAQPTSARPETPVSTTGKVSAKIAAKIAASEADLTRIGFPAELTTL